MKKLCVGSVFTDDYPVNRDWLTLQLQFLQETTSDFDHYAVVNHPKDDSFNKRTNVLHVDQSDIVVPEGEWPPAPSRWHRRGLETLLAFFRANQNKYSAFLFLDSDAFPIRKNWLELLLGTMQRPSHQREIAVPIRFEHMEQRLHPCVIFLQPFALDYLDFTIEPLKRDHMLGGKECDITLGMYQEERRDKVFTLVNSNQTKVHPLLCMVYYDMFYHHGCGSRRVGLKGIDLYWKHVITEDIDLRAGAYYRNMLMRRPRITVRKLAGWSPSQYP